MAFSVQTNVASVKDVFPDINEDDIIADLETTQSVERTISNILDGTFHSISTHAEAEAAPPSIDDIPEMKRSNKSVRKRNIPDFSDSSDDDVLIAQSTGVVPHHSPVKKAKVSIGPRMTHCMSDTDSDDDLPAPLSERLQLKSAPAIVKVSTNCQSNKHVEKSSSHSNFDEKAGVYDAHMTQPSVTNTKDNLHQSGPKLPLATKTIGTVAEKQLEKAKRIQQKEDEKQQRMLEREEKKQQKEYEKAKKKTLREAQKCARPGEAIKQMTVMIDPSILKITAGTVILDTLQKQEITYEIQAQPVPGIITFWREVTQVIEKEPLRVDTEKHEVVEDQILLHLPVTDFISLVHNFKQKQLGMYNPDLPCTLREHIIKVRKTLENRKVTLIIQDIEKYFRDQQTQGQRKYRGQLTGQDNKGKKKSAADVSVSRLDIEEALIDSQLHTGCSVRFVATDVDMGKTVLQFTKAVADAPFKRDRLNTGLSLYVEATGSTKISKDGHGVTQAWRQQLQQFKNVKAEIANAIMSQYKSPLELWKAYQRCSTHKEAELLLQDIVIRRGVGVMATSRRVGKELSRRLYQLYTSEDPQLILK